MLQLYGHPFSSYTWKILIALYERRAPFEFRMLDDKHPENFESVRRSGPTGQFPVLVDGERVVIQSAAIIDYLDLHCGTAPPMVPADPRRAIEARMMDAVFDDYVMTPVQRMVANALRPPEKRDPFLDAEAKAALDKSYVWLDARMRHREWAADEQFGIADCAAAPALFYANWAHPVPEACAALRGYRARLAARPSVARVIDEARPWRDHFPLKEHSPE